MKYRKILIALTLFLTAFPTLLHAESLQSPNYKIVDVTTNSGGDTTTAGSGDYQLLNTIGDFSGDPRLFSDSYRTGVGVIETFLASVPKISCFETNTDGSSQCTTGPSYLNSNGMVTVCGPNGCYNRARFEIDAQGNPSDTLYAIQISEDNFASDVKYVDGLTFKPKSASSRTISDYLTKSAWETEVTNILGLNSSTQYWIRVIALHGDFTESEPGPVMTTTTSSATMNFDIDIADINGVSANTEPPFNVSFSDTRKLIKTGPSQTAEQLIWLDAQTNAEGGFAVVHKGLRGGLFSSTQNYTIESSNADLDSNTEGFGMQNFYSAQERQDGSGSGELGTISISSDYTGSNNNVGLIDQVFTKLFESNKPVLNGRIAFYLKARASGTTPGASDYTEEITLIMVPRY